MVFYTITSYKSQLLNFISYNQKYNFMAYNMKHSYFLGKNQIPYYKRMSLLVVTQIYNKTLKITILLIVI